MTRRYAETEIVRVDIWGGENSMDHVARFHRHPEAAAGLALCELRGGFLVNLRQLGVDETPDGDFDDRTQGTA